MRSAILAQVDDAHLPPRLQVNNRNRIPTPTRVLHPENAIIRDVSQLFIGRENDLVRMFADLYPSHSFASSDPSGFSSSTSARPACGPNAIETATARFSSTTGDGITLASTSYSLTIPGQSVSSGVRARAWQAAISACSRYGPGAPPS